MMTLSTRIRESLMGLRMPRALEMLGDILQRLKQSEITALAQLAFIKRCEIVYLLAPPPPGTGKSHLASAMGVTAVKAGKSVYRTRLAQLINALVKADRASRLANSATKQPNCFTLILCDECHDNLPLEWRPE